MGWYPDWPYRVAITSQNAKVAGAVTNAYIDLSELPAGFWANVQNGGGDIRITQSDGETEVAREIVSCDTGTDTGEVHFDCTGIQTGSDVIWYLYYGNAAASDYAEDATYGREAVWDANHKGVWHMKDLTTSSILDSTSGDFDGAKRLANEPIEAAAKIGNGQYYDGLNDYIQIGDKADFKFLHGALDTSNFQTTLAFWMSNDIAEPNDLHGLISTGGATESVDGIDFFFDDRFSVPRSRRLGYLINRGASPSVLSWLSDDNVYPNDTNLHFVVATYDQSLGADNMKVYIDNVLIDTETKTGQTPSTDDSVNELHLGSIGSEVFSHDGLQDEVRISDTVRSVNWMTTVWNNQNDPSTFWSVGSEEAVFTQPVIMI